MNEFTVSVVSLTSFLCVLYSLSRILLLFNWGESSNIHSNSVWVALMQSEGQQLQIQFPSPNFKLTCYLLTLVNIVNSPTFYSTWSVSIFVKLIVTYCFELKLKHFIYREVVQNEIKNFAFYHLALFVWSQWVKAHTINNK